MKFNPDRDIENRLIFALIQTVPNEDISSLLNNSLDWKYIFQAVEDNRVTPLLAKGVKFHRINGIPPEILHDIQARQQNVARINFGRATQLVKLARVLQDNNIDFIAYKGATLAKIAYNDLSLRQFTDIDLLIHKEDFPKVKSLFLQLGCKSAWKLDAKQEKAVLKYYYEYPFVYPEHHTLIELHWQFMELFFAFDYDYDKLWRQTQNVELFGQQIPTLSVEDSLIFLCVHGSKHFWTRLNWICDIAKLVENTRIDWDKVFLQADQLGCRTMVCLGLLLARDLLNIELSPQILTIITQDRVVQKLSRELKENVFHDRERNFSWIETAKIHLKMRERKRDKFKYVERLLKTKLLDSLFLPMGRPQ